MIKSQETNQYQIKLLFVPTTSSSSLCGQQTSSLLVAHISSDYFIFLKKLSHFSHGPTCGYTVVLVNYFPRYLF